MVTLLSLGAGAARSETVSNGVVSLTIEQNHGGSISSFKVLGTETINSDDLGRDIQASIFHRSGLTASAFILRLCCAAAAQSSGRGR